MFVSPQEFTKHGDVMVGRVWWHVPVVIPTPRLRQDCEFKTNLGHTARAFLKVKRPGV